MDKGGGHSQKVTTSRSPSALSVTDKDPPPMQLALPFFATPAPTERGTARGADRASQTPSQKPLARLPTLDRLTVREVLKVVPINRSTLFRWVNNGRFPKRHKAGGWLRSDIEKWLTEHEEH
jgi:predicted DNA-binding transcriptional regulator AlpA